jgi:hypothetical protein
MNHKRTTTSIVMATLMLVSLLAVVSSAARVSGQTMAGTGPAATYGVAGIPVLVAVDTSGHVWWYGGGESSWSSIGGSATSSPAATTPYGVSDSLMIDVFVRGTDGAVWYTTTANNNGTTWSDWNSLGGQVAASTGPAACSWGAGRLDVFIQGTDGALWHKWSTNGGATWSKWESLGGKLTSSPAASPPATNQVGVFVRGTDGACWYKDWTGTAWSSWKSFGGQLAPNTGPAGEVFVQGTNHQLWYQWLNGTKWSGWLSLPACPEVLSASSPAPVMSYDGHTEVFVSTTSGNLMYCYVTATWNGTAWVTSWTWYSETSPP